LRDDAGTLLEIGDLCGGKLGGMFGGGHDVSEAIGCAG